MHGDDWAVPRCRVRVLVTVHAAGFERYNKPLGVPLDTSRLGQPVRVVEVDGSGKAVDDPVAFQPADDGLTLMLGGTTPADGDRRFHVYAGGAETPQIPTLVRLEHDVEHEGQLSFRIATPAATYYYHKLGAGFASIEDADGLDWVGYHPGGESAGEYRGIPNMVHPEGYFHPGGTDCTSWVAAAGPIKVSIRSESNDGGWACTWDVYPHYATLTVPRVAHPYWFLYEGTPGGELDECGDYVVRSPGRRTPASEKWDGPVPDPEWVYFGAAGMSRVLYCVHHEADDLVDSYWPMRGQMTVFGFGRLGLDKFMERVPSRFTIGFAESGDLEHVAKVIDSAFREVSVTVGEPELPPSHM